MFITVYFITGKYYGLVIILKAGTFDEYKILWVSSKLATQSYLFQSSFSLKLQRKLQDYYKLHKHIDPKNL